MNKSQELGELLNSGDTLVVPDAYDPISAKIIERLGFKAVQCSGYSISLSLCYKSEANVSFAENLDITRKIVSAVSIPVMADGEDGFGDVDTARQTVREYLRIGVAGMNIEDQILPQGKCVQIVDTDKMIEKIIACREVTKEEGNPHFIINARTDALLAKDKRTDGLKEAIKRANRYLEAGADLAFICYVANLSEVNVLRKEVNGPISIAAGQAYNIREFSINDLKQYGVARISLPTVALFSGIRGVTKSLRYIYNTGEFVALVDDELLCSSEELAKLQSS